MGVAEFTGDNSLLQFCKATADQLRLEILRVLSAESYGVLELAAIFDTAQPGMSHHLKILAGAGLVERRKQGNSVFYRRAVLTPDSPLHRMTRSLYQAVDQLELPADVTDRCRAVHAARAETARAFFNRNAAALRDNQDLIADLDNYQAAIDELLDSSGLQPAASGIEVGPGHSALICALARRLGKLTALDISEEMLDRARRNAGEAGLTNVDFTIGELASFAGEADLVVLNMVLHHLPSPAGTFRDARRVLTPGGYLLIADLCPHDQDWTRDTCGDQWLGFEPGELDSWAQAAGLERGAAAYIAQKNGFQVQVRLFRQPISNTSNP